MRSKFEEKNRLKKNMIFRRTQNTPRNPQQPGDRDQLETACDETRPTRSPILARFRRSRVCASRPRTALAISKNDECYTYRQTDRQTNKIMAPCTHPGTGREVNEASRPHTCGRPCAPEENKPKKAKSSRTSNTPASKCICFSSGNSLWTCELL